MNLGLYSYLGAAIAYGLFTFLLFFSWRGSLQGKFLTIVTAISAIWASLAAYISTETSHQIPTYQVFEVLRYIVWYIFLLKLFDAAKSQSSSYHRFIKQAMVLSVGLATLVIFTETYLQSGISALAIIGHVIMALIGMVLIEQLFRNTSVRHRWSIKYLFIGAGIIFTYDFYLYTDALLFRGMDAELWEARGIINLVVIPLLVISAIRSKNWALNIFVSRDIALTTTAIFFGGAYLLVMASAGYYLREYGGSWGRIWQVLFLSLAVVLLASILSSIQLRAKIRVFLGKHFYKNKYDYRIEWLGLTEKLTSNAQSGERYKAAIEALANIVDARAGLLWLRDDQAGYKNVAAWHTMAINEDKPNNSSLVNYFKSKGFIINLNELDLNPEEYEGLVPPEWLEKVMHPWLILPLQGMESLIGFVVLSNPLVARTINWEDRDLLITAAKQVSSYLTVLMTSDALAEAKQFEVFTRLSAYMVHDLKNIASELEMVSRNSKKHMSNPEFIEDAFDTVDNAASDIKRLLEQLRNKQASVEKKSIINLADLVQEVVNNKQSQSPQPKLKAPDQACFVAAEKNRLANVLAHLIDNAQQATENNGSIHVTISSNQSMHTIEINDNGHGMDEIFIRDRLFKPFDTTKGNAGMGIGMHESREFMQQLGGDIRVQSKVGQGSAISLHIPIIDKPENATENI
ncbi:MAG: PEP-CTERM system histidine kinase PrsK [Gammaproteobacteria bacterium]|nr:PEP-CTERM system histidine kinase PrsK [Gammaproteobacteria bacterium]